MLHGSFLSPFPALPFELFVTDWRPGTARTAGRRQPCTHPMTPAYFRGGDPVSDPIPAGATAGPAYRLQ